MPPRSVEAAVAVAADPEAEAAVDRWDGPWRAGPSYGVVQGASSERRTVGRLLPAVLPRATTAAATATLRLRAELLDRLLRRLSVLRIRVLRLPVLPAIPVLRLSLRLPAAGYPYAGTAIRRTATAYPAGYGYGPSASGAYAGVRIRVRRRTRKCSPTATTSASSTTSMARIQHLELTPGAHSIEIHAPGMAAMVYDVNVQPGRTVTLRVR